MLAQTHLLISKLVSTKMKLKDLEFYAGYQPLQPASQEEQNQ